MDLLQAIKERHSVRKYIDRPIEAEKVAAIRQFIDECNRESGLHLQLVTEEPLAFSTGLFSYGKFTGVKNYIALVAPKQGDYREAIGYQGEKIVLFMQTLGLNTCWVGLTFKNIKDAYVLNPGEELKFVIACGYGEEAELWRTPTRLVHARHGGGTAGTDGCQSAKVPVHAVARWPRQGQSQI